MLDNRKIFALRPFAPLLTLMLVPLPGRYGIFACLIWARIFASIRLRNSLLSHLWMVLLA